MGKSNSAQESRNPLMRPVFRLFVHGLGMRPDGTGSVCVCIDQHTNKSRVKTIAELSKLEAEYHAVLMALEFAPAGAGVHLICSSPMLCCQFEEIAEIRSRKLVR